MKSGRIIIIVIATFWTAVCPVSVSKAAPMGTVITYQGRLLDANEPADGLVEGAAIKGSAGNWTGFDLDVSKYSDGSSISDTTQVYVKWMALRKE
jgi:hypothetical protein